ncbi:F-box protein At5g07610-like [Lolium rigidum]|uniref:F-box protein At5g07610-like n=1 Tax=Lolium rigidum TaxID=89674 RepID=UPI001F5E0E7D|nr:F-box protein At5g07610-like [Lolium rigidum]
MPMQQGGGDDGCKDQRATGNPVRDSGAPSDSPPPFPSTESPSSEKLEHEDEQQQAGPSLPEDALVEILSRVPYRSLRRFKCVSKPWLALCSATDIRRRSPQTLSGFFHFGVDGLMFHNLSGRGPPMVDPSLPFLRRSYKRVTVEQCCSSLLLCQCAGKSCSEEYDYVVCNPATERCHLLPPIVLPDGQPHTLDPSNIFLGFDTAAPSSFLVFAPMSSYCDEFAEVAIYSSDTRRWTFVQSNWGGKTFLVGNPECVFLNGIMHMTTHHSSVATVDAEGKVWRTIEIPGVMPNRYDNAMASIGQSQGRLHAWRIDYHHDCQLYVWVLVDYESGKWSLKHTVNVLELFRMHCRKDVESYTMFAIHPECDLIFLTDGEEMTMSYDMDNQKVHVICTSEEFLGGLPYTPCFAE